MDLWDSFVGKEDMYVRDGLHLGGKGAAVFAEGLSGASTIFKLVGQGGCQRRINKYKKKAHARKYREAHPKKKLNAYA